VPFTRKLQIPGFGEGLKAAVVGLFDGRGETAAGKLTHFDVILQAVAADAFVGAGVISTGTAAHIFLFFAVHKVSFI
jgi:hypothetical protein